MAKRYNIACGTRTSNNDILDYLLRRYDGSTYVSAPSRVGDVMHTLADISAAKRDFGYVPKTDVWEGITRTCDWYDKNWDFIKDLKQNV